MRVGEGKIQKKRVCGPTNDTPVAQNKNVATFCLIILLQTARHSPIRPPERRVKTRKSIRLVACVSLPPFTLVSLLTLSPSGMFSMFHK